MAAGPTGPVGLLRMHAVLVRWVLAQVCQSVQHGGGPVALVDYRVGAGLLGHACRGGIGGPHDDDTVRAATAEVGQRLQTTHVRHLHIEDDGVGAVIQHLTDRDFAVLGDAGDAKPRVRLEQERQQFTANA